MSSSSGSGSGSGSGSYGSSYGSGSYSTYSSTYGSGYSSSYGSGSYYSSSVTGSRSGKTSETSAQRESRHSSVVAALHVPCNIRIPRPWPTQYPNQHPITASSRTTGSRWTDRCIVSQHISGFTTYFLEKMIGNQYLFDHRHLAAEIKKEIVLCIASGMLQSETPNRMIAGIVYDFTYDFRNEKVTPDKTSKFLWYIFKKKYKWIPLETPAAVTKIHLTKAVSAIHLQIGKGKNVKFPMIRILPRCIFKYKENMTKHRFNKYTRTADDLVAMGSDKAKNPIRDDVHIDWIVDGALLEADVTVPKGKGDNLEWHRLAHKRIRNVNENEPKITHVMPMERGLMVRDSDGKLGYLESVQISNPETKSIIRAVDCMVKIFQNSGCQKKLRRQFKSRNGKLRSTVGYCVAAVSQYCWNGCCEKHCFETAAPCSLHKKHWRKGNGAEDLRLSLCHRWD